MTIPKCPENLPTELSELISKFASVWAASSDRPKPTKDTCNQWEELLDKWVNTNDLPLFARKSSGNRGTAILHSTGRVIVPTDNSPAQWAFTLACQKKCPTIDELRAKCSTEEQKIPIAKILSKAERINLSYGTTLSTEYDVNQHGWKLGHIERIGLRNQGEIRSMDIEKLKAHHRAFLLPSNMFLVPKQWAGLAEIDVIAIAMKNSCE